MVGGLVGVPLVVVAPVSHVARGVHAEGRVGIRIFEPSSLNLTRSAGGLVGTRLAIGL